MSITASFATAVKERSTTWWRLTKTTATQHRSPELVALAIATCMTFVFAVLCLTSCSATRNSVSVGVLTDVPGMSSMDPQTGSFSGYEIDVANEVFNRIYNGKADVMFVGVAGETREPDLNSNVVDALFACYTVTDSRAETYNLSTPYAHAKVTIMVQNDSNYTTVADMDGRTIGVLGDSTSSPALTSYATQCGVTVFPIGYETFLQAKDALDAGIIDGFSTDDIVLQGYMDESSRLLSDGFEEQAYAVATNKDNSDLAQKIDAALADMREDGTLAALAETWNITL